MTQQSNLTSPEMEDFYRDLEAKNMDALWRLNIPAQTREQKSAPYQPCRWLWSDIEPMVWRAGEMVEPGPQASRRVITLKNPSSGPIGATHSLTLAVQLVYPGEVAPSHRHTATAIRFMLQGDPVTLVDGEPITMHPGDLVLTPNWTWHGHKNEAKEPAIWVDNLDVPLVGMLRAGIHEEFPEGLDPADKMPDESFRRFGSGHLKPLKTARRDLISPLHAYPWEQTYQALHELASVGDPDPYDDVALEYTNPTTGGHVLPTLSCQIQMLRPGVHTQAHKHSTSAVYHVYKGKGHSVVDGVQIDWRQGDFFALPPWTTHEHVNDSNTDEVVLYSSTDTPVYEALGLLHEYAYEKNGGRQEVVATYEERYG